MRYILGAGIHGLIFKHFNPDFEVIGKLEPLPKIMDSLVTLHDNPENRLLLESLSIEPKPREKPILYYFNGKTYPYMPEPVVSDYVLKKLGGREDLLDKDRTLSVPGDTFRYLDNPVTEIHRELSARMLVHNEKLYSINDDSFRTDKGEHRYELLVSTLPAPVFWEYWQGYKPKGLNLLHGGATFAVRSGPPTDAAEDFAFIYYADDRPYHRVFHLRESYVYEYAGQVDLREATYKPVSYLRSDLHNIPPANILFCGRHATWKHWYKIEHTVAMSRARFTWELMWNRQAFFQTNFSDFNRDVGELTEDTIYYITCCIGELHEMLNELNWKKWKPGDRPNHHKVLEEYVDALKFMINIAAIWGFGPHTIHEMFMDKSRRVEDAFISSIEREQSLGSELDTEKHLR